MLCAVVAQRAASSSVLSVISVKRRSAEWGDRSVCLAFMTVMTSFIHIFSQGVTRAIERGAARELAQRISGSLRGTAAGGAFGYPTMMGATGTQDSGSPSCRLPAGVFK